jgi:penicillin-binding protein 1B
MDDIMKDVINRGTAAHAQQWGFKNVDGKTAFAGKTGTSRDGWFAGFTPELVCVVYVGFDNGDDLGMKGGDSAMPIWADFMRGALDQHPEWNGDWSMPVGVRRAEIDIRDGKVLRELDPAASLNIKDKEDAANRKAVNGPLSVADEAQNPEVDAAVNAVPAEFRRVELFISGTIPTKALDESEETNNTLEIAPEEGEIPTPSPSQTPVSGTWEDSSEPPENTGSNRKRPPRESEKMVSVMICPVTGMRATANCPTREMRTYRKGEEPKDFCTFHVRPPQ